MNRHSPIGWHDPSAGSRCFATLCRCIWLTLAVGVVSGAAPLHQEGGTQSRSETATDFTQNCSGALQIHVIDDHGVALPGVCAELPTEGPDQPSLLSDKDGLVNLSGLRCDRAHSIQLSSPGFVTLRLMDIRVGEGEKASIGVCLDEAVAERILLVCPGPLVDLEKTSLSTTFNSEFLADLPGGGGGTGAMRPEPRRTKKKGCWRLRNR